MFSQFLLAEGITIEMEEPLEEVLGALEQAVAGFTYDEYGYHLAPRRGRLGAEWHLVVKPRLRVENGQEANKVIEAAIGYVTVARGEEGGSVLTIPPRDTWASYGGAEAQQFDGEGRLFTSFILQLLNAFQERGLLDLPGTLPTR